MAYWAPYLEKLSALLIDAMRAPDLICGKDVVVLGAGIGGFTAQVVALRPKSLVAVEPSTLMSDRIDRAGGLVVVENCQAQSMRIGGDGAFDTVCIAFMLQELDLADMNDVVINAARLLKPGGSVCVVAWGFHAPEVSEAERILDSVREQHGLARSCRPEVGPPETDESRESDDLDPSALNVPQLADVFAEHGFKEQVGRFVVERLLIRPNDLVQWESRRAVLSGGEELDRLCQALGEQIPDESHVIDHSVSIYVGKTAAQPEASS